MRLVLIFVYQGIVNRFMFFNIINFDFILIYFCISIRSGGEGKKEYHSCPHCIYK